MHAYRGASSRVSTRPKQEERFTSTTKLRSLLVSITFSAAKHIEDAVALLSEGGLERSSEAELMDLVVAETSRIMHLARDLAVQLRRRGEVEEPGKRQRQPKELLLLLRNAVRFPRLG